MSTPTHEIDPSEPAASREAIQEWLEVVAGPDWEVACTEVKGRRQDYTLQRADLPALHLALEIQHDWDSATGAHDWQFCTIRDEIRSESLAAASVPAEGPDADLQLAGLFLDAETQIRQILNSI